MLKNILDPDGTHDILFAQRIDSRIPGLIAGKLGNHSPFEAGVGFPIALVERTGPGLTGDEDQWAANWTDLYFETLLKPLSRTFILTDGYLNGSAYGFEPEYFAEIDQDTFDSVWGQREWPEEIKITVPAGKTALVTWLEKAHPEVKSAPFCDKLTNPISVWMRQQVALTAKNEALEWIMPAKNADFMLHNSLVVVNGAVVTTPASGADLVRFQRLQATCYLILNGLDLPEQCKVLTGLNCDYKVSFLGGLADQGSTVASEVFDLNSPIFQAVPENFYFCFLDYAIIGNNPLGKLPTVVIDIFSEDSLLIHISLQEAKSYFEKWANEIKETSPWGYELSSGGDRQEVISIVSPINLSSLSGGVADTVSCPFGQQSLKTFTNNHPIDSSWELPPTYSASNWWTNEDYDRHIKRRKTSYPALYRNMYNAQANQRVNIISNGALIEKKIESFPYSVITEGVPPVNARSNIGFADIEISIIDSSFYRMDYTYYGLEPKAIVTGAEYDDPDNSFDGVSGNEEYSKWSTALYFESKIFSFTDEGEIELFSKGETISIISDIQPVIRTNNNGTENFRFNRQIRLKFLTDYDTGSIQVIQEKNSADLISNNYEKDGVRYGDTTSPFPFLSEQSFSVRRYFRTADSPTSEFIKGYYSTTGDWVTEEISETELESILYPDGPDGPPLLDPDTDGGDIMPDSIRIKEIHAALDAARFANHSQSTEENPKVNLRNLGRLLEAAAYVLGVNFDEDGLNVAYPDPVLFDPEKIEEINSKKILKNAQFAVAEMNGGLDTSALYEVRSAIAVADRKGSKIDQRPYAIKYHNLPQLMDAVADDNAKMMGGGKNSIFQVPNAMGDDFQQYDGIYQAMADCLYMLSAHSKAINELQNQGIRSAFMLSQILKAMGVPCHIKKVDGVSGVYDKEGREIPGYLGVPEIDPKSPTLVGLFGVVLMNLQRVVGSSIGFRTDEPTEEEKATAATVTISATPMIINARDGGTAKFVVTRKTETPEAKEELIFVNLMLNSTLGKNAFSGGFKPGLWSIDLQPGETSKSFDVEVQRNETYEENHSITVILSGGEGYQLDVVKTATVAIIPGTPDEEPEEEAELEESAWKLEFEEPDPAPDFIPDLED